MSRIIPKLNLNKTPQLVENNSLVMAKNIRLLEDGTIGPDTSLKEIVTKTGRISTHTVHHNSVTEDITEYQYSILDVETSMSYRRDVETIDESNLENLTFDFVNYLPANIMHLVDEDKYIKVDSNVGCTIYCYKLVDTEPQWTGETFIYNPNTELLINNNGLCFALAIRQDIYDEDEEHPTGVVDYYYCIVPTHLLTNTIEIRKYNYIIINPVYPSSETETITISEAWDEVITNVDTPKYLGQIVGLDNKVYFFIEDLATEYSNDIQIELEKQYSGECFVTNDPLETRLQTFDVNKDNLVTRRGIIFEDRNFKELIVPVFEDRVKILEFDEITESFKRVKCAWKYSGGKINGCVFKNNTGESILTICEYDVPNNIKVPIKHINLSICKNNDNESIYTQNPDIPITNLIFTGEYNAVIPSGVYQFFIRYKIDDNRYTNWFPCSKELFAGSKKSIATIQGELKYIDKHTDSDTSFIFDVQHLYTNLYNIYKKFQIGFILSKDDNSILAREWKEFDFGINTIYFTCLDSDIKEANIDDFLETSYELFNVENCVNYKNKLYIANYEETDFNPELQEYARQISIQINAHIIDSVDNKFYFDDNLLISSNDNSTFDFIGETNTPINNFWGVSPYFDLEQEELSNDDTGTFSTLPYISNITHHVSESNVLSTDYPACHPISLDNDVLDENGCPITAWMKTTHNYNYNEAYILAIYIKHNNNYIHITGEDFRYTYLDSYHSECIDNVLNIQSHILNNCDSKIKERIAYYSTSDDNWYIKIDNNYYPINEYYIVYSVIESASSNGAPLHFIKQGKQYKRVDGTVYKPDFRVSYTQKKVYIKKRKVDFNTFYITSTINDNKTYPTLLPFTEYNFYVHYVKANGVTTNGYLINQTPIKIKAYCKDDGSVGNLVGDNTSNVNYYDSANPIYTQAEDNIILYPMFDDISRPPGYVSCFISVAKIGNNVCQLFNVEKQEIDKIQRYKADCIELDTLTYTKFNNLRIYKSDGIEVTGSDDSLLFNYGKYFSSGNTEDVTYFGECGSVVWDSDSVIQSVADVDDDIFWIVIDTNETAKTLIKFTPYIKLKSTPTYYDDYNNLNNIGFVCFVKKLKKQIYNKSLYISDSYVYEIDRNNSISGGSDGKLTLEETLDEQCYRLVRDNKNNRIKSNFNFNFLTLSQDITPQPKTIDASVEPNVSRLVTLVNSLTSSFIYEFNNYYKEYTRKYYSIYEYNKLIRFDNTIRCSIVIKDEEYNTFKFNATDYYNVPTLRGVIVNLISIANSIYVHCKDSLFKFTDNKTLNGDGENITLQENDIFDSGISEVFDSQYGYGGLQKREHSLITYNAYIFYDATSKIIYAFGGEQQIGNISQSISKLIEAINPDDVKFVADELHNRFFVNFKIKTDNVCLSFNFANKSFISIHDFDFKFGFHTRSNTYYIHENLYNDIPIGFSLYKIVDYIKTLNGRNIDRNQNIDPDSLSYNKNYSAYQNCYKKSFIYIADCDDVLCFNEVKSVNSCVDIIVNTEYEKIKVLNYLSWICSAIERYGYSENNISEEVINRNYPGHKIRIYSDSTEMALYELLDNNEEPKIANNYNQYYDNTHEIADRRAWQYPQNNCGIWSMNYFRDIKNIIDIFNYKADKNKITGGEGHSETTNLTPQVIRENLTQESSLLYGKYFVVRFIFNNRNFKLENLILRMNDYEKTK